MILVLIDRLKWEPMSLWRAAASGTDDLIGWDPTVKALASVYDQVAARNKGRKLRDSERYPVPKIRKTQEFKPEKVKDLDWHAVMGGLRG